MRIATWNVNSVLARLPLVTRWLTAVRPDVLALQETKCTDDRFPRAAFAEIGYDSLTFGQATYNGVAFLTQTHVSPIVEIRRGFPDDEAGAHARLLGAHIAGIDLLNVYIPNGAFVGSDKYGFKLSWMKRLRALLDEFYDKDAPLLLCGDFNVAPEDSDVHDPKLWRGKILCSEPERAALNKIREWGLIDAFRLHTPEKGHYSWWDYRAVSFRRNAGLRIDHIWVTESLTARCSSSIIDREPRAWERPSDHTPVIADFE